MKVAPMIPDISSSKLAAPNPGPGPTSAFAQSKSETPVTKTPVSEAPKDFQTTLNKSRTVSDKKVESNEPDPVEKNAQPNVAMMKHQVAPRGMTPQKTKALGIEEQAGHREAWMSFLGKMKDLGVHPQKILQAFQSLTKEELKAAPEKNVDRLVAQLGLNDQQAILAKQFFKELIALTDPNHVPVQTQAGAIGDIGKLAGPTQVGQFKSLGPAANGQLGKPAANPTSGQDTAQIKQGLAAVAQLDSDSTSASAAPLPIVALPNSAAPSTSGVSSGLQSTAHAAKKVSEKPLKSMISQMIQQPAQQVAKSAPQAIHAVKPMAVQKMVNPPVAAADGEAAGATSANGFSVPTTLVPVNAATKNQNRDAELDHDDDDGSSDLATDTTETEPGAFAVGPKATEAADAAIKNGAPAPTVPVMAPHEIVQQANVLIRDGGGEMKVMLKPEGLGEVAMRVSVVGNKVNVEMLTQSPEAKKALETSFHNLKDSLGAHQLNLESIKVDTIQSLDKQLDQQYQDAQRQSARQFLEQFHQSNQERRQSYFDYSMPELYRAQSKISSAGQQAVARAQRSDSRRLDLVA